MSPRNDQADSTKQRDMASESQRLRAQREKTYREQALRMYPHICAHCGREFDGAKLRELTVHHKDHNHDNNPADGSNWELLCMYCHDNEHERFIVADSTEKTAPGAPRESTLTHNPFACLAELINKKK